MINGYIVHYYLGNKKEQPYKLWIAAHNAEDAKKLCTIQAGHRHGYSYKITVTSVEDEAGNEIIKSKPKRQPVPEIDQNELIQSIIRANNALSVDYKSLGKRHTRKLLGGLLKW